MSRPFRYRAFLNVPYDKQFEDLYLAFIAGLSAFGLNPRATLEIPGGARRLDRIFHLITNCRYSFHDLSRVELDPEPPPTPRFNMPFELGLVLGWLKAKRKPSDTWFVFESVERRLQKSLSDLSGTEVYVHDGTPEGVFRDLGNALVRSKRQPTVQQMKAIYEHLRTASPLFLKRAGARSLFEARVFQQLVVLARSYTRLTIRAVAVVE